jgi:cell fate regulator YaaT (PSP1 superfamily)
MGCSSCSSGGCGSNGLPKGCKNNGACGVGGCNKLEVFDWLAGMHLPAGQKVFDIVEVRFKNSRKAFFKLPDNFEVHVGDVVAVESSPGHDIGVVSLTGELVNLQMRKKKIAPDSPEVKKVYRKAKQADIDKWKEAQQMENETMYKARKIAVDLNLSMKISDVEYQGDKSKATFYYTADDRVDFRELIKILAETFKVRIEMRQIGARQEAGRLGGIGSCGRELCCSTWLTDFRSVTTSAARYQQLALNPLKLAGQCGKLKCCLNYELDTYLDSLKEFPNADITLKTAEGDAIHIKTDIFKKIMWYTYKNRHDEIFALDVASVKDIISLNKQGKPGKPLSEAAIQKNANSAEEVSVDYENVVGQDDINRFMTKDKKNNKKSNNNAGRNQPPRNDNRNNNNPNNKNRPNQANKGSSPQQDNKQGNKPV